MENKVPTIQISKIDAAKRQLETTIDLYFHSGDPVSIHTLAAASYDVLHGLCKAKDIKSFVKNIDMIREEKRKDYLDMMNEPQNFFKHANHDQNKLYEFRTATTDFFIWDACQMYQKITEETVKPFYIFVLWFYVQNPDVFNEGPAKIFWRNMTQHFDTENRLAFWQQASSAYDLTRHSR
jgi:hypothetical protein